MAILPLLFFPVHPLLGLWEMSSGSLHLGVYFPSPSILLVTWGYPDSLLSLLGALCAVFLFSTCLLAIVSIVVQ